MGVGGDAGGAAGGLCAGARRGPEMRGNLLAPGFLLLLLLLLPADAVRTGDGELERNRKGL